MHSDEPALTAFGIVGYGMKTMSCGTAPTENGEPLIGVSAPELESKANPAICCGAILTYTNLPVGSTAMDDGWALVPSEIGLPATGVKLPAESILYTDRLASPVLPTNTYLPDGDVPACVGGAMATGPGCGPLTNGDPGTGLSSPVAASRGKTGRLFVA